MAAPAQRFRTDEEAMAFLMAAPQASWPQERAGETEEERNRRFMAESQAAVNADPDFYVPGANYTDPVDPTMNLAPENVPVPKLGPDPLMDAAYAAVEAAPAGDDYNAEGEPRLPSDSPEPEDAPLPPVRPAFASDEDAMAFLQAGGERPAEPAGPTGGPTPAFASDEEAMAFLQAGGGSGGPALPDPEAMALNLSFGGQEAAIAKAVMGDEKETPPPVTTPEAADGTDVKFEEGDAPFKYTGRLVMVEGTGPTAGLDGMMPVTPAGPVAPEAMAGTREPAMNRRPRLVPDGGQIVFDQSSPERFTEGVERAFESGLLPQANYEKIKANQAAIFKVVEDRKKLEAKAQADPRLLAVLQGVGKGGAITAGAITGATGGAKAGTAAGAALGGPVGAAVGGVVGGVAGGIGVGIAAGVGYDALYKQLAKHFEEYDNVMQAAELYPQYKANGELAMAAISLGAGGVQGARGLMNTAAGPGGVPAAARQAAVAGAAGAGTGVVAYPIDAAVRGEEITPGGFATAAGVGVLGGGFFINSRLATQKDLLAVSAKIKAGQKLTAAEEQLVKAAEPAMRAAFAEMEAAGGQWRPPGVDARGRFVSNEMEVRIPQTTVAGFMPASGRATARIPYDVPLRLGAPAMARAEAFRAGPRTVPPAATAGAGDGAATAAPARPVTAPVNVLDPGMTPIPMPGPIAPAVMGVDAFLAAKAAELGLTRENTDEIFQLMEDQKRLVLEAIDAEQPVSVDALNVYEIDVPYYVRNEETGLATFDAETFKAWSDYITGQDADMAADNAESGVELLDAIAELGGLPSQKAGDRRGAWAGELASLLETAQGSGKGKASDNQKGVFLNKLFRKDAKDIDDLVTGLRGKGFRVETPQQLIDMLDMRLRSGRPVYGYGLQADEPMPAELRGRRPAPGAPRQMDLLGESDVEFTLQGQTDRTSLTPEEMIQRNLEAQRAQDAEKLQADLFGEGNVQDTTRAGGNVGDTSPGPTQVRSGGGGRVPPGPTPPPSFAPPRWVTDAGETSQGRRLIKGISKFKPGQQWAYGDIITMVRRAIGVESRRSRSQTTATHPAHYRPQDMIEFTRDPFGQMGFHEAGHQLQYMLQARVPGIWQAHETELLGLTQRPGSMASEPPDGATPRQKHIYRVGEGVAEWLRLLVTDPGVVERMPVSQTIQAATDKHYPGVSRQVRDAVRAMNAFQSRPAVERAVMLNNVPREQVTLNAMWSAVIRGKEAVGNMVASGAAFDRLPRKVFRLIMKDRKQTGMTYREAVRAARAAEKQLNDIPGAYNYILGIGEETQLAISGKGAAKGLRMQKPDGSMEYLTRWTWDDLRARVPAQHLELFDIGAWAFESSERWVREGIEYTGMREGMTPDDLLAIVKQAKDAIPAFGQLFAEQSNFLHTLLEMKEYGQILSREERERVQYKRDAYWPLPEAAVGSAGGGGRTGATINKGVFRAFGHAGPTAKIDAVVVDKVTDALTSVAWNNLALVAEQRANAIAKDTSLPWEARQFVGSLFTEMQMPMSKVAELNFMEKAKIKQELIEAVATAQAKVLGFKPDIDPDTVHVAWTFKDIWRPIEPGDVQIWARFKDGKRSYVQVGDPSIYAVIGAGKNVNPAIKLLKWAFGPASRNMQTAITESPGFAVPSNLVRDVIQQLVTNTDSKFGDWIPGGSHVAGLINKFTQKYPQVFREGLLLNRDVPTREQLVKRHQQASLWQFLTDGFYVSNAKNPTVRLLGTIFNPSNMLFYIPVWPVVKIANAVAPGGMVGFALGGAVGGPMGAAVGAAIGSVAGPLSGFTGKGIATFTEEVGREGNAVRVLQRGGTDAEAMQAYWFRTGQFNEHPGNPDLAALLRVAPFANPALQSTRNLVQVLTHPDPAKLFTAYAGLAQIAGMAAVAALIKYLMMDRNDRQKERERTIQDRMGYMDMAGIRVPFAYGLQGGVQSLVYNAVMDDLLASETDWNKASTMLAKRVFDPQGMMNIMGPQISSLFELRRNWSEWRQTNIVAPWMLGLPASEQYYSTTPEFYRKLGSMMEWSPAKIQYFVQQGIARQIDDTIRLAEAVSGGKPMQEAADLPFVGRIFVRDPIGFASASVQKINQVEDRLQLLNTRLNAKGWGFLNSFDRYGNPTADASKLPPELQQLQMQLGYLHQLRQSMTRLETVRVLGEAMRRAGNYVGERNARVWQTHIAQATLAGNADRLKVMDAAIEAAQQLDPAPPEQMAADYLQRRF
jgi:hypothetical protein